MTYFHKDSPYRTFLEILKLYHHRMHRLLEEINLYPGQPHLLLALDKKDGQSQRELADKLNIKASTMTVMLKRMEKENLIERKQDLEDQRISRVYITDKGSNVCKKSKEIMKQTEEEMFGNLTLEEKVILRRLLLVVKDNLENSNI